MDRGGMKVYRIKHKPSGLYYCNRFKKLTAEGSVFDMESYCNMILKMVKAKYHKQYHHDEFEIIEYELKD